MLRQSLVSGQTGRGVKNGMLMQTCVGAYSNIIGAVREQEGRYLGARIHYVVAVTHKLKPLLIPS
jgi:hypothetical protein